MSNTKMGRVLKSVLAGVLTLLIVSLVAHAELIEIQPGQSIQTALRTASDQATLRLLPGVHTENVHISRSVRLVGDLDAPDSVILESRMAGPVITITDADSNQQIMLEGMTVRGASGFLPDGILHLGAASVTCKKLIIENCRGNGISVGSDGQMHIEDCVIRANGRYGIDVQSEGAQVSGMRNLLNENGADLGGYANPSLRVPLVAEVPDLWVARVPEDYASLQEAIDAVQAGGNVKLAEGEFPAGVTIWKNVSISGTYSTKTILRPNRQGSVLLSMLASAHHVSLDRLTLQVAEMNPISVYGGADLSLEKVSILGERTVNQDPIIQVRPGHLHAHDCVFADIGGIAIEAQSDSTLLLQRCKFRGNYRDLVLTGVELASITANFRDTRERSVFITDSTCHMEGCHFENGLFGVTAIGSTLSLSNCHFSQMTNTGMTLLSETDAFLENCSASGSSDNIIIGDNATVEILSSAIRGATHTGLIAAGSAMVNIDDCRFENNGVAGLILHQSAHAELVDSVIRSNGWSPPVDPLVSTQSAGIGVFMNASCNLTSVSVLGNASSGMLVSPENPYQDLLEEGAYHVDSETGPHVLATDCTFSGNSEDGVLVSSSGTLVLNTCSFTSNGQTGIYLLGVTCRWTGSWESGMDYHCNAVEGIQASLTACDLRSNVISGLMLEGGAAATLTASSLAQNGIGLIMDLEATLHLTACDIVENTRYGLSFYSERCQDGFCSDPPKRDRLIGFGNSIPGPNDPKGNGLGAFTSSPVEYLLAPSESKGK